MAKQLLFRACNSPLLAVGSRTASLTYCALLLVCPTLSLIDVEASKGNTKKVALILNNALTK